MVDPLSPDRARGWLGILYPLLEKATPITLLFVLVIGTLMAWHLLGQIAQERDRSHMLGQLLLDEKAAHLALARQCGKQGGEGR